MNPLSNLLTYLRARFNVAEEGATMVEYGLMVALVAIVAMVGVGLLGGGLDDLFSNANDSLTPATTPPAGT